MFNLSKKEEERALYIHQKSIVVDTHNDTIGDMMKGPVPPANEFSLRRHLGERTDVGQIDLSRIEEGGVDCLIFAMGIAKPIYRGRRLRRLLQMLDVFYSDVEMNQDGIALATTYSDVIKNVKDGKVAAILSIEGGEPLEGDLSVLRMIYKLGVRAMTLTHFRRNELGDGSLNDYGSQLTDFGVAVLEEMNRLGMIIDISHLNETGFWDVMDVTKSPIIASHSNCRAICDHHRNLSNKQITALAQNGGVINLSFCGEYLRKGISSENLSMVSLDDWLDHLDHVVNLVGPNYVGIGSDFDGGCGFPGIDNISKMQDITWGLVSRGYSDEDIGKILGGNNLRVFKEVLK